MRGKKLLLAGIIGIVISSFSLAPVKAADLLLQSDINALAPGAPTSIVNEKNAVATGFIIVGDSRAVGLDLYTKISDEANIFMIAEVAKGYNWLDSSVASSIDMIKLNNPQIAKWVEVYTLGINDPRTAEKYAQWYANRALTSNVALVSLNPIQHHSSITNEQIVDFNNKLIATGLPYIDLYDYLIETGFSTSDGVHYDKPTYKKINAYLSMALNNFK